MAAEALQDFSLIQHVKKLHLYDSMTLHANNLRTHPGHSQELCARQRCAQSPPFLCLKPRLAILDEQDEDMMGGPRC